MAENPDHSFTPIFCETIRLERPYCVVLLSEAQWCFSACGEAIVSNEMTESDSEMVGEQHPV
jgi:hypothetical protein